MNRSLTLEQSKLNANSILIVLGKLKELTDELINRTGRRSLSIEPFSDVYRRQIAIEPRLSRC